MSDSREQVRHQRRARRKPYPRPRLTAERVDALDYALTHLQDVFDTTNSENEDEDWTENQVQKMADAMAYLSELIAYKRIRA